jgi:hypothetical protein
MVRDMKVRYQGLEDILEEANNRTDRERLRMYDHVSIWWATECRILDCDRDSEVAIIPLTDQLWIITDQDNQSGVVSAGHLMVTPASALPSGKWMSIYPPPSGSSWIELRQSSGMNSRACNEASECPRIICGYSNHEEPN